MIGCDACDRWFHGPCCNVSEERAAATASWHCPACESFADAAVRGVLDHLLVRVEREGLKASKLAARAAHRACGQLAIYRATGRSPTLSASPKVAAGTVAPTSKVALTASTPCWAGPTVVRPAADGSYRYQRCPAPITEVMARPDPGDGASAEAAAAVAPQLLTQLSPDCLEAVLATLPLPALLLSAVPTCHRFAMLAETLFAARANALGLRPARRARGSASAMQHPWRQLLRANTCAVCLATSANFPIRRPTSDRYGAIVAKLCMACARTVAMQQRARRRGLEIDSIGMDGKALVLVRATRECEEAV